MVRGKRRTSRTKATRQRQHLSKAQTKRRDECEKLYQKHQREVYAVARANCNDKHAAADITNKAFTRLLREWERGKKIRKPLHWLKRVAKRLAKDENKSAFRRHGTMNPHEM